MIVTVSHDCDIHGIHVGVAVDLTVGGIAYQVIHYQYFVFVDIDGSECFVGSADCICELDSAVSMEGDLVATGLAGGQFNT